MGVEVLRVQSDAVLLGAPLAPNINHRETVFGGSASAVAILAAWSLLHVRLGNEGVANRLVIQRNSMNYEHPIRAAFTARSLLEQPAEWQRFCRTLARRGRARIAVSSVLESEGRIAGHFQGDFVALGANAR